MTKSLTFLYFPLITKNSILTKFDINLLKEKNIQNAKELKIEANLVFNENNPLAQIYFFQNGDNMILGGYPDNSFKIFKESQELQVQMPKLHSKLITCLSVSEKLNLIITGSRDCRVIVWYYDMKKNFNIEKTHMIYGHNSELVGVEINEIINIFVSIDKDGYVMIHSIKSLRLLKEFHAEKNAKDKISAIKIHSNGLILIQSRHSLHLYK